MNSLGNRIWLTSRSRMQSERRLLSAGWHSQFILLWYSFFGVAIAIYNISISSDSQLHSVTWVIYSVLILVLSGFLQGSRLGERAALAKQCYENLQKLLIDLEQRTIEEHAVSKKYFEILDSCENQIEADFIEANCIEWLNSIDKTKVRTPTKFMWWRFAYIRIQRFAWYSVLYLLPIMLLITINNWGYKLESLGRI